MSHEHAENSMETTTQKLPENGQPGSLRSGRWLGAWSPIEEANTTPRKIGDPTLRLLLLCKSGRIEIGWYDHDSYAKKPRPFWRLEGRWGRVMNMRSDQPTHWMPLPPNASGETRRGE